FFTSWVKKCINLHILSTASVCKPMVTSGVLLRKSTSLILISVCRVCSAREGSVGTKDVVRSGMYFINGSMEVNTLHVLLADSFLDNAGYSMPSGSSYTVYRLASGSNCVSIE